MEEEEENLGYPQSKNMNFPHYAQITPDGCTPIIRYQKEHSLYQHNEPLETNNHHMESLFQLLFYNGTDHILPNFGCTTRSQNLNR